MRFLDKVVEDVTIAEQPLVTIDGPPQRLGSGMQLLRAVLREQSAARVGLAASGAAFWLVISAFPTAIATVSLYGLFVAPERVATDLGRLANELPGSLGSLIAQQVRDVAASSPSRLSAGFVGSLSIALWSASTGIAHLDSAIRAAYGLAPQRFLEARVRPVVAAVAAVMSIGLAAIVSPLVASHRSPIVQVAVIPLAFGVLTLGLCAVYRFSVGGRLGRGVLLPGAMTAALGVVLATVGFSAYVGTSGKYDAVYGAFAGVVVAMLAMYIAVRFVLLGASLNSELQRRRDGGLT